MVPTMESHTVRIFIQTVKPNNWMQVMMLIYNHNFDSIKVIIGYYRIAIGTRLSTQQCRQTGSPPYGRDPDHCSLSC